jgi:hypothetical protein
VLWFVGYFAQTYHNLTRKHFLGIYGLTFFPPLSSMLSLETCEESVEMEEPPVLLEFSDVLVPVIQKIVSLSLNIVPTLFKEAVVKPLIKKHNLDPEVLSNYRPVSNLLCDSECVYACMPVWLHVCTNA